MFYRTELKDHIRVDPRFLGLEVTEAVEKAIRQKFTGHVSHDLGIVIDVSKVSSIGEGVIIPGDGANYYDASFELITFKPEMHEVIPGRIKDIADFGAFITLGPLDGMIHISQTMDDFVSFAKDKVLGGKESKKSLRVGDVCRARVIAVSFKDITNPKIGLTMRQQGLGRLDWIEEENGGDKPKDNKKDSKDKK